MRRIIQEIFMPDRICTLISKWGQKDRGKDFENFNEFLNRHNNPLHWENEKLDNDIFYAVLDSDNEVIYPGVPAEFSGVVLESDFKDDAPAITTPSPHTFAERAVGVRLNTMLYKTTGLQVRKLTEVHKEITGVRRNQVPRPNNERVSSRRRPKIDIEDVDTNSYDEDDDGQPDSGTGTPPPLITRRYEDIDIDDEEDDDDGFEICEFDGRDFITRQNEYHETNLAPLGGYITQESPRGRGNTRRQQRQFYTADGTSDQRYKYPDENAVIHVCHRGAGYGNK